MSNDRNITHQDFTVTTENRESLLGQRGCVIWLTGLSGAGKSTIAEAVEKELNTRGKLTFILDGDNLREGLCSDLRFTDTDREENLRRVAETSKLFADAGVICLSAFISPSVDSRQHAIKVIGENRMFLIHVSTPLATCESRDTKGLYQKARNGEIINFTGIDSEYVDPVDPNLSLDTSEKCIDDCVKEIIQMLEDNGRLKG